MKDKNVEVKMGEPFVAHKWDNIRHSFTHSVDRARESSIRCT